MKFEERAGPRPDRGRQAPPLRRHGFRRGPEIAAGPSLCWSFGDTDKFVGGAVVEEIAIFLLHHSFVFSFD
jgi:hypothetical protein